MSVGFKASQNTTSSMNVAIGYEAGRGETSAPYNSGESNISIGSYTNHTVTQSKRNVSIGGRAGYAMETGTDNTLLGNNAGYNVKHAVGATIIGGYAGRYATGSYNTFIGYNAGDGATTSAPFSSGENNVAIGDRAMRVFTTGHSNVVVGNQAGYNINSDTYPHHYGISRLLYNLTTADNTPSLDGKQVTILQLQDTMY